MNDPRAALAVEVSQNVCKADIENVSKFPGVIGTFMGRDALSLAVSYLGLTSSDTVLLPAYLCQEVLRPFAGKTRVEFYDVLPDLTIDPDEIRVKLNAAKVTVMVIINYFGFLQPHRREIRDACADCGALLMEDCAHSLLTDGSGEIGDLSIYSFRKLLPVPDGGGLKVNLDGDQAAFRFYPRLYSNLLSFLIVAKACLKVRSEKFSRAGMASRTIPSQTDSSAGPARRRKSGRVLPLSSAAERGICRSSFPEITRKRRSAFELWQEVSKRADFVEPVFEGLAPGVCPMNFPIKVKDRDALKAGAGKKGIYLNTYWRLPACVGDEFRNSRQLAQQVAALPVQPEVSEREREVLANLIAPA